MPPSTKTNRKRPRTNLRRERKPRVPWTARIRVWRERIRLRLLAWRRPLWIAGQTLLMIALVLGAAGVYRLLEGYVRTAPAFATRVVEVEGLRNLQQAQVWEAAGLRLGQNIFEVGADQARLRLEAHPWLTSVQVERRLPDTYRIELQERVAVALLALDTLYLVADDGTVFKTLGEGDPSDLPVITGADVERFWSDATYRSAIMLNSVALLHDYASAGSWPREPVAELHVEPDQGLALYVGDDPTCIRLGQAPYGEKLQRLRNVLERLEHRKLQAAYVYLDNVRRPDRVTVKLR